MLFDALSDKPGGFDDNDEPFWSERQVRDQRALFDNIMATQAMNSPLITQLSGFAAFNDCGVRAWKFLLQMFRSRMEESIGLRISQLTSIQQSDGETLDEYSQRAATMLSELRQLGRPQEDASSVNHILTGLREEYNTIRGVWRIYYDVDTMDTPSLSELYKYLVVSQRTATIWTKEEKENFSAHLIMNHASRHLLGKMKKAGLLPAGVHFHEHADTPGCKACLLAGTHRQPANRKPAEDDDELQPGEMLVCDLWGPVAVPSIHGHRYMLCAIDPCRKSGWSGISTAKPPTKRRA